MSDKDIRHYLRAEELYPDLYPDGYEEKPAGHVVASGTDRADVLPCEGGCWAPAWVWIDDATAVKYRFLTEK